MKHKVYLKEGKLEKMKIETKWKDCIIFLVGFLVEDKRISENGNLVTKLIKKTIIFDSEDISDDDCGKVERYVLENFGGVIKVEYIDVWDNTALMLKA